MNFYETFCALCDEKKVTKSRACIEAGLSKSLANKWMNNPYNIPNGETLGKLANYFCVSPSYFLVNERSTANPDDASVRFSYLTGLLTPEEKLQVSDYIEFLLHKR